MKRKRFNRACIASSENYVASKKAHRQYLNECHQMFIELEIEVTVKVKSPYVRCFGKLIAITEMEAMRLGVNVIWR